MFIFGKSISISASYDQIVNEFVRIVLFGMATIFWLAEEALDTLVAVIASGSWRLLSRSRGSSVQWKISPNLRTQLSFGETLALLVSAEDDAS